MKKFRAHLLSAETDSEKKKLQRAAKLITLRSSPLMSTRSGDYNRMHCRWLQRNSNSSGGYKGGRVSYGGYQGRDFNGRGRFYTGRSRILSWKKQLEWL